MGVIKELENKVVHQQTQKLQELGPSNASKTVLSPMHDNSALGPMEETTLDFENLVLGKKKMSPPVNNATTPTSPPLSTFQTQPSRPQPFQPTPSPRATTPMSLMQPMQPTSSTPTTPNTFYPTLQPTSPSAFPAPATRDNGVFPSSQPLPTAFNAFPSNQPTFSANPWGSNSAFTAGNSSGMVLPTIAPPPAKTGVPQFGMPQTQAKPAPQRDGLDKYQSLL
jgi:hypothetical protein